MVQRLSVTYWVNDMNVAVCCPSYKRPYVETLEYIPYCKVYVDGSEYEEYKAENPNGTIVRCQDGVQGNLCRVRNYILKQEFEAGADAVVIIDDDMKGIYLWVADEENKTMRQEILETEMLMPFFEKYSEVCKELGFYFWGMNCNQDALSYRQYSPLSFSAYIGGPFQAFLKGNECWYDEKLPLKEDYDMTLQQCNKYRGCLRLNFATYNVKQSEQAGGCASIRSLMREKEQFEILQKKWGKDIVREDMSNKGGTTKQKRFDYNPIIKIPLAGI